ncbi:MAG: RNA 2',3'-cyclic phosphodiesterase [Planctomycetaceae bacterium]|jgi:RNA 2',3'-cyclic 3'-phosphodiesterase|nr:RNA 2',3'-cyclic phosphodiesterase [Planctomycetaceae bacterium]MBT6153682.1 RNA 2',3'-cyclic phosphodiesterase [Planctomycetaceae bacterium]MBT6483712.1 RNA 2',3'-cyclic phosphodiesterase [Planctomycetaceae bacterium]MBT6497190.1 RNA 2',3'-cyclic phosphodiesterase [Planctomycetaceae bacterium]
MSDTARLFIAVKIAPSRPLRKIVARLGMLGRIVKPIDADNLHLTLKFLGETELALTPQISQCVEAAAAEHESFSMQLVGLGAFPHVRRPSVVWVGLQGAEPLVEIASELERLLQPLGFEQERRAFHPHVTVARIRSKPPRELATVLETEQSTEFGSADVTSVELYQSELRSAGPRYTVLSKVEFAGG